MSTQNSWPPPLFIFVDNVNANNNNNDNEDSKNVPVIDAELREAMDRLDKTLQERRKTKNPFPVLKKPDFVDQLEVLRNAFGPVKQLPKSEVQQEQDILDKISQLIRLQVSIR